MFAGPRWLAFLAASAVLLAGCSGGESARPATNGSEGILVSGRIVDDNQLPIAGGALSITQRRDNSIVSQTNASDAGEFSFGKVATGTYFINVRAAGFNDYVRPLDVIEGREAQLGGMTIILTPVPVVESFHETVPKRLEIQYGLAYAINGDFNQGCLHPAYTCNALVYPYPNAAFEARDPSQTPWAGAVFEESWVSTSQVCAKAVAVDIYNPDAPNIQDPNRTNPHYWTNYPSSKWRVASPIHIIIPRNATGDTDALDADWRVQANGGKMLARGNWTVRNFPPGKGLTNLAADINCFMDQKFDLFWTNFYLDPAPAGFTARQ